MQSQGSQRGMLVVKDKVDIFDNQVVEIKGEFLLRFVTLLFFLFFLLFSGRFESIQDELDRKSVV